MASAHTNHPQNRHHHRASNQSLKEEQAVVHDNESSASHQHDVKRDMKAITIVAAINTNTSSNIVNSIGSVRPMVTRYLAPHLSGDAERFAWAR